MRGVERPASHAAIDRLRAAAAPSAIFGPILVTVLLPASRESGASP
jgi:hypothetical protein